MRKNEVILLLSSIFILTFAWIGFSVYHNAVSSTIPESQTLRIVPIDPTFDTQTIEKLKKRHKVLPFSSIQRSTTPSISPTSTESARIEASPKP